MYEKFECNRTVSDTARDIDDEISNSMGELYYHNLSSAYDEVLKKHSAFDIALTTVLTINHYDYDGRISTVNKQWAKEFLKENNINAKRDYDTAQNCTTHLAVFDGFSNTVRKKNISIE